MSPKSGTVRYNNSGLPGGLAKLAEPEELSDSPHEDESPTLRRNLDTSPKHRNKYDTKNAELPEMIPMLARNENGISVSSDISDFDNFPKPAERKTVKKPNEQAGDSEAPEYKNIFTTKDNYVNVPAMGNNGIEFSNPAYITFDTVNERAN